MQDNAPTHTAHRVRNWLREFALGTGVDIMDWPPYSPDLNPIENVWALLKEKIIDRYPELDDMPNTPELFNLLERAAVECWEDFGEDLLYQLISTMPHRIQALHSNRGWYTKY